MPHLVIRDAQLRRLGKARMRHFLRRVENHVRRYWPERCRELGEEAVRRSVLMGYRKSLWYGIESERGIVTVVEVMYSLGFDFDTDPRYPWARRILDSRDMDEREKRQRLHQRTLAELESTP